jgi:hypothetical protein
MTDPNNPTSNNNWGRTPHHHNTRFRASLTSQDNPNTQDTWCAHCGIQHPAGDCPTAVEGATPSPIRRVAQVQQQVEQVIQRELDTLHVFTDTSPPALIEQRFMLWHVLEQQHKTGGMPQLFRTRPLLKHNHRMHSHRKIGGTMRILPSSLLPSRFPTQAYGCNVGGPRQDLATKIFKRRTQLHTSLIMYLNFWRVMRRGVLAWKISWLKLSRTLLPFGHQRGRIWPR